MTTDKKAHIHSATRPGVVLQSSPGPLGKDGCCCGPLQLSVGSSVHKVGHTLQEPRRWPAMSLSKSDSCLHVLKALAACDRSLLASISAACFLAELPCE